MASIELVGVSAATFGVVGVMDVTWSLTGDIAAATGVSADFNVIMGIVGSVVGGVSATGYLQSVARVKGFYESTAAQITKYFQEFADTNSYVVRYDNDLRSTPTDDLWCNVLVDFGVSEQHELGNKNNFRVVGKLSVRIINAIGEGLAAQLEAADLIADEFRTKNVGRISFGVPTIQKVGRVGDNEYINVTCPFLVDKQ